MDLQFLKYSFQIRFLTGRSAILYITILLAAPLLLLDALEGIALMDGLHICN